jgi:hypothetical protein
MEKVAKRQSIGWTAVFKSVNIFTELSQVSPYRRLTETRKAGLLVLFYFIMFPS